MAKIASIKLSPDEKCIEILENALALAKEGTINQVALACVMSNTQTYYAYNIHPYDLRLLAVNTILNHTLTQEKHNEFD